MTRTLTDEQWDALKYAADEYARITEQQACKDCTAENGHRACKDALSEANEIRQVLADVDKGEGNNGSST